MSTLEKVLLWLPRDLCIIAILFVSMFSLDAFEPGVPFSQQILAFLMHSIPSFILLAALILAWKRELWGGIIIGLIGLATAPFVYSLNYSRNHSIGASLVVILLINIPFIVIGILFIVSYWVKRRRS